MCFMWRESHIHCAIDANAAIITAFSEVAFPWQLPGIAKHNYLQLYSKKTVPQETRHLTNSILAISMWLSWGE